MKIKTIMIHKATDQEKELVDCKHTSDGLAYIEQEREGVYVKSHRLANGDIIPAIILGEITTKHIQCVKKIIPVVFRDEALENEWNRNGKVLITNGVWLKKSPNRITLYALTPETDNDMNNTKRRIEFVFIAKSLLKVSNDVITINRKTNIKNIPIPKGLPLIKLEYNTTGDPLNIITLDRSSEIYKTYSLDFLDKNNRIVLAAGHKTIFSRSGIYASGNYMTLKITE